MAKKKSTKKTTRSSVAQAQTDMRRAASSSGKSPRTKKEKTRRAASSMAQIMSAIENDGDRLFHPPTERVFKFSEVVNRLSPKKSTTVTVDKTPRRRHVGLSVDKKGTSNKEVVARRRAARSSAGKKRKR